jgi:hypothetical protein
MQDIKATSCPKCSQFYDTSKNPAMYNTMCGHPLCAKCFSQQAEDPCVLCSVPCTPCEYSLLPMYPRDPTSATEEMPSLSQELRTKLMEHKACKKRLQNRLNHLKNNKPAVIKKISECLYQSMNEAIQSTQFDLEQLEKSVPIGTASVAYYEMVRAELCNYLDVKRRSSKLDMVHYTNFPTDCIEELDYDISKSIEAIPTPQNAADIVFSVNISGILDAMEYCPPIVFHQVNPPKQPTPQEAEKPQKASGRKQSEPKSSTKTQSSKKIASPPSSQSELDLDCFPTSSDAFSDTLREHLSEIEAIHKLAQ